MSHRQYLPAIPIRSNSISIDCPIRKRNTSFDSINFSTESSLEHDKESLLPIKKITTISYSSKKPHLFEFFDKDKIKNPTKRCQETMETYINLKKEISDIKFYKKLTYKQNYQSSAKKYNKIQVIYPSVGIYNFPSTKIKNIRLRLLSKPKHQTETRSDYHQAPSFRQSISLREFSLPLDTLSKKYNDLSLKQITECDLQFVQKRKRINVKQQSNEIKETILIVKDMIRQQEPLNGW